MDKQILIELIKIVSPYVIAILGILSSLFTTKYLNKEDFKKYKKQRNYDNNIKIYPTLITELNEIRRISGYIISVSNYYENLDYTDNKVLEENENPLRIKEVIECTQKYDNILSESTKKIRECLKENFIHINDDVVDKITNVINEYDSPINLFDWKFQLFLIKDKRDNVSLDTVKFIYKDCKRMFNSINTNAEQVVKMLKNEITGENKCQIYQV